VCLLQDLSFFFLLQKKWGTVVLKRMTFFELGTSDGNNLKKKKQKEDPTLSGRQEEWIRRVAHLFPVSLSPFFSLMVRMRANN